MSTTPETAAPETVAASETRPDGAAGYVAPSRPRSTQDIAHRYPIAPEAPPAPPGPVIDRRVEQAEDPTACARCGVQTNAASSSPVDLTGRSGVITRWRLCEECTRLSGAANADAALARDVIAAGLRDHDEDRERVLVALDALAAAGRPFGWSRLSVLEAGPAFYATNRENESLGAGAFRRWDHLLDCPAIWDAARYVISQAAEIPPPPPPPPPRCPRCLQPVSPTQAQDPDGALEQCRLCEAREQSVTYAFRVSSAPTPDRTGTPTACGWCGGPATWRPGEPTYDVPQLQNNVVHHWPLCSTCQGVRLRPDTNIPYDTDLGILADVINCCLDTAEADALFALLPALRDYSGRPIGWVVLGARLPYLRLYADSYRADPTDQPLRLRWAHLPHDTITEVAASIRECATRQGATP